LAKLLFLSTYLRGLICYTIFSKSISSLLLFSTVGVGGATNSENIGSNNHIVRKRRRIYDKQAIMFQE